MRVCCVVFRAQDLGCRVWGAGLRVEGSGDHSLVLLTNGTLYGFGKGEVPKGAGLRLQG